MNSWTSSDSITIFQDIALTKRVHARACTLARTCMCACTYIHACICIHRNITSAVVHAQTHALALTVIFELLLPLPSLSLSSQACSQVLYFLYLDIACVSIKFLFFFCRFSAAGLIYRCESNPVVCLLFFSGRIVCTGANQISLVIAFS